MDVSVIIPVYNTEKYLAACIDSVLQQTYVSLEIILVDDGSTDSSASICDVYTQKHDNIKAIHIQNSGPATAKNEGLKLAQGNYIALTDSDDKMELLMLHKMVTAGYEHHADIICCNYKQIDENGNISHLNSTYKQYVLDHEEGLVHFFSKDKIYSQCWTKLYKRQMLIDYHIENDPGLRTDEDFIFNIRAFVKAQKTVIVDEPLYEYTHRENSLAHSYFKKNISQYIDNRIKRVHITQEAVKNETAAVKEWSIVHIIMYYNELVGKVSLFPEFYSDNRIIEILNYIKHNKKILHKYYKICGFSKIGKLMIINMPNVIYMKYRQLKNIRTKHLQ
ncbi:Glycosyl transferase family 2 [Prevotella sp. ne3005]|uniref:glycosyltransferase family 2 protein n=1 Tax=Prevotella sp. ne3005 TaxID=1761887 RepID=UPI0008C3C181|nr:glycosyltransferase [Prevotella sp. ne3005]SEM68049.1 Glycosyl transferase family 2 [Prevotella sp. ne3005]